MRGCVIFCCGQRDGTTDGTETRGVLRGPRGPKNFDQVRLQQGVGGSELREEGLTFLAPIAFGGFWDLVKEALLKPSESTSSFT